MAIRRTSLPGQNPGLGKIVDGKTYIGIVKNNVDGLRMGRLQVWIPEMGGAADDESHWHIVSYASPFGGSSPADANVENSQSWSGSQTSYGWWAVPPDLGNEVLCTFVNGEAVKGFWFACVWQQNMNHMVPGIASNRSFSPGAEGGILPPVAEYNKNQSNTNLDPRSPTRPRYDPLHNALMAQGLYTDFERGPTSASARRETPAKVYGLLSPYGSQMYIDDDSDNAYIRMRTRNGAQVLIHDTTGYVYINSAKGNSWIEISDIGIDLYSAGPISINGEGDVNIKSSKNINLDAGENINLVAKGNINTKSGGNTNIAAQSILAKAAGEFGVKADMVKESANQIHQKAANIYRDGLIQDNAGSASDAGEAEEATQVSRIPTHEPFKGHPKTESTIPVGEVMAPPSGETLHPTGSTYGSSVSYTEPQSADGIKQADATNQRTGEGSSIPVERVLEDARKIKVGTKDVPQNVVDAIQSAANKLGLDVGYLMAMAEQESSFRVNIQAPTSSASGLFQFTNGTWEYMIKKYPSYGYTMSQKHDPEAQSIMAGLYTLENKKKVESASGKPASSTDLYLGHFLGGGGASRFLSAMRENDSAYAVSAVSEASAKANASIFFNDPRTKTSPRTIAQVYALFAKKIEPKAEAYRVALANNSSTTLA